MSTFEKTFNRLNKINLKSHIEVFGYPKVEEQYFNAGQESRQTEVDEITQLYAKELFSKKVVAKKASEKLAGLQLQNDELQKRVDKAIRLLVEAELYQSEPNIDLAVQALKGGSDE